MYESFYNLKAKPFNNNPDPRFFYPSARHAEALDRLYYAVVERKGFVVVTGEIGAGKTTVCRALLKRLDDRHNEICVLTNTHLSAKELIIAILEDLNIPYRPGTKAKLLSQLNDYLVERMQEDKNVILIIDEAQNLTPSVLEEVRMLSNLETDTEKLLQIILIGQPELRDKLRLEKLEQFRQRIAIHYHLSPLSPAETGQYVRHRLGVVAGNGAVESLFSPQALEQVFMFSQGIPRLINYICDHALLSGFVAEKKEIDAGLMREVIGESRLSVREAEEPVKTYCCEKCRLAFVCTAKELRKENGRKQVCCELCAQYKECHEQAAR
ncbi:MAG: ExeA family protein [Deltaproteobacteria bacterium]